MNIQRLVRVLGGLTLGISMFTSTAALADGTDAGTNVSNTVTVDYNVGGVAQPQESDNADFVVDRKIDLTVSGPAANVVVVPGSTNQLLTYTITNDGNGAQGYDIDVAVAGGGTAIGLVLDAGGTFDPGEYQVYVDDGDASFNAGTDTLYTPTGTSNAFDLIKDATQTLFIVANIPAGAADAATDTFTVTATTLDNGTATVTTEDATNNLAAEETVFVDAAGATDALTDGMHSDTGTYEVQTADLVVTKVVQVINQDGAACATATVIANAMSIPGACVEYTISITNNGSAAATAVTVADTLPGEVAFVAFHSTTSAFDTGPTEAAGVVSAVDNSLAGGGASVQIVIRATVN